MRSSRVAFVFFFTLCIVPALSSAQLLDDSLTLRNTENAISINLNPRAPEAGSVVQLTAESPLLNLSKSFITWSAGGRTIAEGYGVIEARVTLDTKGTPVEVSVSAVDQNWGEARKSVVIGPPQIDILFDADTYVPPFYRGRALPSAGAALRLQALVRFARPDGTLVSESVIRYSWKRNGAPLGSVSGLGRSSTTIPAPALFSTDIISLEAHSDDGAFSGTKSVTVASREPALMLYEDSPIFGILFHEALSSSHAVVETRMTFAAIPYFATAERADDPTLRFKWTVNRESIASSESQPNELTVNADRGGIADITLTLTQTTNLFLGVDGRWSIEFSSTKAAAEDLFNTP